ncbi:MAG TPA: hypothetical protein V6C89_15270 [Drouetiella sp.]
MSPEKIERIVYVGDFNVHDGKILATDPSRQSAAEVGQVLFQPCESGLWRAFVEDDTVHTYKLIAIAAQSEPHSSDWAVVLDQIVAVETCQAGLFDSSRYAFDQEFYEKICDMTVREVAEPAVHKMPGVEAWCFGNGVVSGTATESGDCLCYAMTNSDGIIYGVTIVFYKSYMKWTELSLSKMLAMQHD